MIDTTKYFFNRDQHTEFANKINSMATAKNVQVSRWVNNSHNRQVVTYIVHTGERAARAADQENVLFRASEESARNAQIRDEWAMLTSVRDFIAAIPEPTPEPAPVLYYAESQSYAGSGSTFCTAEQLDEVDRYYDEVDPDQDHDWTDDSDIHLFDVGFVVEWYENQARETLDMASAQRIYDTVMKRYSSGKADLSYATFISICNEFAQVEAQ